MQQAIYNSITPANTASIAQTRNAHSLTVCLRRHLARKWDLYGVLTLIASSAAYGVYAIVHAL